MVSKQYTTPYTLILYIKSSLTFSLSYDLRQMTGSSCVWYKYHKRIIGFRNIYYKEVECLGNICKGVRHNITVVFGLLGVDKNGFLIDFKGDIEHIH